jgi:peptidoglycan hydrolase-like protein with peptidoglycan-binding domain
MAYTMEVSNSPDFASSTWIPYVTTMPWTLSSTPGAQTVYVQYRAVSGSIAGSAQASITLLPAVTGLPSPPPTAITAPSSATSTASLLAELNALEAELASLKAQAGQATSSPYLFTRDLSLWSRGNDVKQLQLFLIEEASGPAAAALARHGATNVFGMLTYRALVEFQQTHGITPAKGYFGPKTRAWLSARE